MGTRSRHDHAIGRIAMERSGKSVQLEYHRQVHRQYAHDSLVRGSNDPVGKRCGEHETMLGMQNLRFPEADRGEKRLAPFGSRVQRGPFNRG